ncbi:MAG: biotin/lipoyl-binding protein, partial [Phycisphaerales bacterium]|nr:biotin/lipoyl-binding protein [Phycisphaerales bacterium]
MNGDTRIPMPPRRWLLRFGLPVLVLAAAAALLLSMLWTSIVPAREITAVPTVVRDVEIPFDAAGDDQAVDEAVVQAPGWVEPDPYGIYAGALVEGVVKELLVLEGDPVKTGQPVATLVDDEARIALQRAKANVLHLHAEMLMVEATRDQLPSRLDAARARLSELE